jgi:hypothetical protein
VNGRFCDELGSGVGSRWGFGWIADEPAYMQRASHALADRGRVWLVDPVDVRDLDERVSALGEPAGVIRLMKRHERDGSALAERFGIPLLAPGVGPIEGAPFEVVRAVDAPGWRETALWWPERSVLVVADVLGTARYFLAPGERLGVHPLLRLLPPRSLAAFEPEHVLCGHGEGVHSDAAGALCEAIASARRRTPRWLVGLARRRG